MSWNDVARLRSDSAQVTLRGPVVDHIPDVSAAEPGGECTAQRHGCGAVDRWSGAVYQTHFNHCPPLYPNGWDCIKGQTHSLRAAVGWCADGCLHSKQHSDVTG